MIEAREFFFEEIATGRQEGFVDVTNRSERDLEKITMGMLRNMSDKYFVNDAVMYAVQSREDLTYHEVRDIILWVKCNVSRRYIVMTRGKWITDINNIAPDQSIVSMRFRSLDEAILFKLKWT